MANQLRPSRVKQQITKIKLGDGNIICKNSEINDAFRNFYSQLYTSGGSNEYFAQNLLNNLNIPTLISEVKNKIDEPFSLEEISLAIHSMQSGKAPGPDGYTSKLKKKICTFTFASFGSGPVRFI